MRKLDLIQDALQALQPEHLEVLDESHTHSRGQETHYKAVIVSEQFTGLNSVKRHQKAYAAMGALMQQIHALALHTYTPEDGRNKARPRHHRFVLVGINSAPSRTGPFLPFFVRLPPRAGPRRRFRLYPVHPLRG